jgi:Fe-S cluster assembly protein SufD
MASKVVISSTRRSAVQPTGDFSFTKDLIPALRDSADIPQFLRDYRLRSWRAFQELHMPTTTEEAWRRTDIRGLKAGNFAIPKANQYKNLGEPPKELLTPLVGKKPGGQIVAQPGGYSKVFLKPELVKQGVVFCDMETAEKSHPEILAHVLGQIVHPDEGKFAALASAFSHAGVLVYVPRGVEVEDPLHSILWGPGVGLAHFSHVMVWLDEGASLTYVHEVASNTEPEGQTLHAGIVEINLGAGSNLRFVELQSWGEHVWNFSHERARVGRDAQLDWIFGAIGSHLTKNFSDIDLIGQGATARMSGFYFTDGVQHLDHDTQQNHLAPDTTSDLLFKGALKDHSRSIWQGMIYVAPGAQKTDGYQANRNLTLSPHARADSIPGLEILADDVRCTHGATVGKVDPEQIFYLQSRGISHEEAVRLIVEGFFDPIMQRIPFDGVRKRFQSSIHKKMI